MAAPDKLLSKAKTASAGRRTYLSVLVLQANLPVISVAVSATQPRQGPEG
jgi:hypothetical protein